ncbi:MAG: hypothetical protein R3Y61_08190 [Rikenellaceae bacterium]
MKRIFYIISLAVFSSLLATSCEDAKVENNPEEGDSEYLESFMSLSEPCVYVKGETKGAYDKTLDQIVVNSSRSEYMVASGSGESFYSLSIDGDLTVGQSVLVTTDSYGVEGVAYSNLGLEVKADSLSRVYLWSESEEVGFVLLIE